MNDILDEHLISDLVAIDKLICNELLWMKLSIATKYGGLQSASRIRGT